MHEAGLGSPGGSEEGSGPWRWRRAGRSAGTKLGDCRVDWEGSGGENQGPGDEGAAESEVVETGG